MLSILVPAYNEAPTVGALLDRLYTVDLGVPFEVIVVDDGSTDATATELAAAQERHPELVVLRHERNRGKGAAIRTALAVARGEWVLIQDADLEYDPADIPKLLHPALAGRADLVLGSRFLGGPQRVHLFWHYVGNRLLTTLTNLVCDLKLTDMETGYKLVRRELLERLRLRSDDFTIEPELTVKAARAGARIYEVPISYWGRDYSEGKKITWRDGVRALLAIWRYRFLP